MMGGGWLRALSLLILLAGIISYMPPSSQQPPGAMLKGVGSRDKPWGSLGEHIQRRLSEPQGRSRRRWDSRGDFEGPWLLHIKGVHLGLRERVADALYGRGGLGSNTVRYVPHDTLLVVATRDAVARARVAVPEIAWAGPLQPHHRVDPGLYPLLMGGLGGGGGEEAAVGGNATISGARRGLLSRQGRVELSVIMARGSGGALAAEEWGRRLEAHGVALAGDVTVRAASEKKLIMSVDPDGEAEAELLAWVAQQPEALWVEQRERFALRNKWAKGVMQSGRAASTPLWDKGLKGEGQVIGIADTGIQHDLCFFHDPNFPVPFNTLNDRHRKIIYYKYEEGWGSKVRQQGGFAWEGRAAALQNCSFASTSGHDHVGRVTLGRAICDAPALVAG